MRRDACQFTADRANVLAAFWDLVFYPEQFFYCEHVVYVICQWGKIIQTVCVWDELIIGHVLSDLLIPTM